MAIMVHYGLFVGPAADAPSFSGSSVLRCAKDPWFVSAENDYVFRHTHGLNSRSKTISSGMYVVGIRTSPNELILNMVDADRPKYFSDEMVNAGLNFITERFAEGDAVLLHCNMGISRSPSMAFLWMFEHGFLDDEFRYAVPQFKKLYKDWAPANGIWQYLKARCSNYTSPQS